MNTIAIERDEVPCGERKRLLIVDDEFGVREVLACVLHFGIPDCRIDVAVNGEEAISAFLAGQHDIIVMDLKMPIMDGDTAFLRIRDICELHQWPEPAVIFFTAYEPSARLQSILQQQSEHCLLYKPVSNTELIDCVKQKLAA